MKKILKIFTIITGLLLFVPPVLAQKAFYFGPNATVNVNDSVVIRLNDYQGDIQWQKSLDLENWENIDAATRDTLLFVADTTSYFRAEVIAGDCDPFYSDTTMVGVYKIGKTTVLIDDYDVELISDSTQLANGVFVYSENITDLIEVGSVLVGSENEGYIRIVTEIQPQKNQTIVITEEGDLTDVFDELVLEDFVQITMSDSEKSLGNGREIPMEVTYLLPGAKFNMDKSRFSFTGTNFTIEIPDLDDEDATHSITATINNGSILFEPVFDRILDIGYTPVRVNRFGLIAGGDIDYELDVTLEAAIDITAYEAKQKFITYSIGPVFIGPVPMIISYTLEGVFNTGLDVGGEISFGFKSGYEAQFGAIYDRSTNPQWNSIWNAGNKPFTDEYLHSNVYSNIYASIGVENKLAARIAGVAGPYLSVKPYLRSDLGISASPPEWNFLLSMGITNKLGFDVKIIGKTLADFYTTLPGLSWDIYEASGTSNPDDDDEFGQPCPGLVTFTDPRDGNVYNTVLIGDQCWMKDNLAWLPEVGPPAGYPDFGDLPPRYFVNGYFGNNVEEAKQTANYQNYGVLYNQLAAQTACPAGWKLPEKEEWENLVALLDGEALAGGKMKSTRTEPEPHPRWNSPNTGATNESGFSALPGGGMFYNIIDFEFEFDPIGLASFWWSSTLFDDWMDSYYSIAISTFSSNILLTSDINTEGFSIRCIKD
jgi:uncharacterized protein (TIGR02145 family)